MESWYAGADPSNHHLPIPAANQALIIRPAFSTSLTCHPPIWSKELTNREMFRPKYQCWWPDCCLSCSVFSVHCSPPTVVSDMRACPSMVSWACRTSLSMPASLSASSGMKETKGWVWRARYEDTFSFSEDNEHSFASTATGVARTGIPNTVTIHQRPFHHHHHLRKHFEEV